ncbi:hypothetical protein CBL_09182 [Carabus blaptoides fortunei]
MSYVGKCLEIPKMQCGELTGLVNGLPNRSQPMSVGISGMCRTNDIWCATGPPSLISVRSDMSHYCRYHTNTLQMHHRHHTFRHKTAVAAAFCVANSRLTKGNRYFGTRIPKKSHSMIIVSSSTTKETFPLSESNFKLIIRSHKHIESAKSKMENKTQAKRRYNNKQCQTESAIKTLHKTDIVSQSNISSHKNSINSVKIFEMICEYLAVSSEREPMQYSGREVASMQFAHRRSTPRRVARGPPSSS